LHIIGLARPRALFGRRIGREKLDDAGNHVWCACRVRLVVLPGAVSLVCALPAAVSCTRGEGSVGK
jgi:hypothetical protein